MLPDVLLQMIDINITWRNIRLKVVEVIEVDGFAPGLLHR